MPKSNLKSDMAKMKEMEGPGEDVPGDEKEPKKKSHHKMAKPKC